MNVSSRLPSLTGKKQSDVRPPPPPARSNVERNFRWRADYDDDQREKGRSREVCLNPQIKKSQKRSHPIDQMFT